MSSSTHAAGLDFVEEYDAVAERFGIAVASSDPSAAVPACRKWSTYDLVVHLGNVHAWAAAAVETGRPASMPDDEPPTRDPVAMSEWYAGKAEDLYEVLRAAAPDAHCWNFAGAEGRADFWSRRQVHETAMHLLDLGQAAGRTTQQSAPLAAGGIDEVLRVFVPLMHARGRLSPLSAPLTIRAVDLARTWRLHPVADGPPALAVHPSTRDQPDGDAVNGPAAVLWRLLWKRLGRSPADGSLLLSHADLSYDGDVERITDFLASRLTP